MVSHQAPTQSIRNLVVVLRLKLVLRQDKSDTKLAVVVVVTVLSDTESSQDYLKHAGTTRVLRRDGTPVR